MILASGRFGGTILATRPAASPFAAMNLSTRPPHGDLVVATPADHSRLSRQASSGQALRLASGIYAVGATLPPEQVTRHHLHAVIAHIWPGAVFCGRTALAGGAAVNGEVTAGPPSTVRCTSRTLIHHGAANWRCQE